MGNGIEPMAIILIKAIHKLTIASRSWNSYSMGYDMHTSLLSLG